MQVHGEHKAPRNGNVERRLGDPASHLSTLTSRPLPHPNLQTMNISRQHGKIVYNFVTKSFDLIVLSKNGISVNHTLFTPQSLPKPLHSRDLLQVGDKSFHFLLPRVRRANPPPAQHTAGTHSNAQPSHPQAQLSSGAGLQSGLHLRDGAEQQQGEQKRARVDTHEQQGDGQQTEAGTERGGEGDASQRQAGEQQQQQDTYQRSSGSDLAPQSAGAAVSSEAHPPPQQLQQ